MTTRRGVENHNKRSVHRCLAVIKAELFDVSNAVESMATGPDLYHCILKQHEDQTGSLKIHLGEVLHSIVTIGLAEKTFTILKVIFNMRL